MHNLKGWVRDGYDERDYHHTVSMQELQALPFITDLRSSCPAVRDQGQLGSCTGFAITGMLRFNQMKEQLPDYPYSELFLYYAERDMEGDPGQDNGAQIRDGMKVVAKTGVCSEALWPYDISKFAIRPPDSAYQAAKQHTALQYARLEQSLAQMQGRLAQGYPFVFGFVVYESFESDFVARSGVVPMPKRGEAILGGHAVMCVGYDMGKKVFLVQNSWGTTWGMNGYFTIPFSYLRSVKLSSDFWTITTVH
jgi:C1A family cysteine protease